MAYSASFEVIKTLLMKYSLAMGAVNLQLKNPELVSLSDAPPGNSGEMSPNFKVMGFLHASLVPLFFFMSFIPKICYFRIYRHAQKFFAFNFSHIVPESHHSNFIL